MRFLMFTSTIMRCLCRNCAIEQLSVNQVAVVERQTHTWVWDQRALVVLDRCSEQPCTACKQEVSPPNDTAEHLLLYLYRVVKSLKAYREPAMYQGTLMGDMIELVSERFPQETEAIRADIQRLVE